MAVTVYVGFPSDTSYPGMRAAVDAARQIVEASLDCVVQLRPYDHQCSLRVNDLLSQVMANAGPILLLKPVQGKFADLCVTVMSGRVAVLRRDAYDDVSITNAIEEVVEIHNSGEPHVPRRLVVALLMMRKLDKQLMWAGRNKGYMWVSDLPKGRGLDEQFADDVPSVLSLLLQHGIVIFKISKGGRKVALNRDRRPEIYKILRERSFAGLGLAAIFQRDARLDSCRHLDLLQEYDHEPLRER